jgi:hypothetical protein
MRWRGFCEYTASSPKNKLCRPSRDSQFILSHRALPCPATICGVPAGLVSSVRPYASYKPRCAFRLGQGVKKTRLQNADLCFFAERSGFHRIARRLMGTSQISFLAFRFCRLRFSRSRKDVTICSPARQCRVKKTMSPIPHAVGSGSPICASRSGVEIRAQLLPGRSCLLGRSAAERAKN